MITGNTTTPRHTSPVSVSLSSLKASTISDETLLSAFGPSSLGILIVSDLPAEFFALRKRVLTSISRLAHLPVAQLDALANEKAKYLVGWSHGKESLREGVVDWLKGSYYVNAAFGEHDDVVERMRRDYEGFDEYLAPNIWPDETLHKELEGFRTDVEALLHLIVDVARHVARSIDRFAEKNVENWPVGKRLRTGDDDGNSDGVGQMGYLEGVVSQSRTTKARLLHYFSSEGGAAAESSGDGEIDLNDSWCTIHKDHGCLTGLTSAAFFDETPSPLNSASSQTQYTELDKSPSSNAGLYILDRESNVHKVGIPRDCLAFQTGEALELVTKGKLKAVPHFVRGVDSNEAGVHGKKIARDTLAVFTQPNLYEIVDLDQGITFGEFARGVVGRNTTG